MTSFQHSNLITLFCYKKSLLFIFMSHMFPSYPIIYVSSSEMAHQNLLLLRYPTSKPVCPPCPTQTSLIIWIHPVLLCCNRNTVLTYTVPREPTEPGGGDFLCGQEVIT